MRRITCWTTAAVLAVTLGQGEVQAQYGYVYPRGYGGWPGWGGVTAPGSIARGMGAFAQGLGRYNLRTAQAEAIETAAAMRFNEYLYRAQQRRNEEYLRGLLAERRDDIEAYEALRRRIREHPTERDIQQGDALNAALDELTAPGVGYEGISGAGALIPSEAIKAIPFQAASQAITVSMDELTDPANWPEFLRDNPAFAPETEALRRATARAVRADKDGELNDATIRELQDAVAALRAKVDATYTRSSPEWSRVAPYLKGLAGLARMLERPRVQELLRHVDKEPSRPLSEVLAFMDNFNLRFGVAETAAQRRAYEQLWPLLDRLRDEVAPKSPKPPVDDPDRNARPGEFFGAMPEEALRPRGAPGSPGTPEARPDSEPAPGR